MYNNMFFGNMFLFDRHPFITFLLIPLMIWSLIWKGMALWKAAKREDKAWFIALLIINTMGILEILYIYLFSKDQKKSKKKAKV